MKKGQTLVEYVLVFCALAVITSTLVRFLGAARRSVARTEALVAADSP